MQLPPPIHLSLCMSAKIDDISLWHPAYDRQLFQWNVCTQREYWTIYRGQGFLADVQFGSSPSPVSKLDRRHTGRLRNSDNLLTEGGGGGTTSYNYEKARSSKNRAILSGRACRLCLAGIYSGSKQWPLFSVPKQIGLKLKSISSKELTKSRVHSFCHNCVES